MKPSGKKRRSWNRSRRRKSNPIYQSEGYKNSKKRHDPKSKQCEAEGCENMGRDSDHIIEMRRGGQVYALSNRQSLCEGCHRDKTARAAHYMYDFMITVTGLIPKRPLRLIKPPVWLIRYLMRHKAGKIHDGTLYNRIKGGDMPDLKDRLS